MTEEPGLHFPSAVAEQRVFISYIIYNLLQWFHKGSTDHPDKAESRSEHIILMISIVLIIRSARHQVYCALPHQAARSTGWYLSINPAELISEGSPVTVPFSMASTTLTSWGAAQSHSTPCGCPVKWILPNVPSLHPPVAAGPYSPLSRWDAGPFRVPLSL